MEYKSAISELFTYIGESDIKSAKQTLKRVKDELSILKEKVAKTDKGIIKDIENLVNNIDKGQIDVARGKCKNIRAAFNSISSGTREYLQPRTNDPKGDQSRERQSTQSGLHKHHSNGNENRQEDIHMPKTYETNSEQNNNSSTTTNPQAASQHKHGNSVPRKENPQMASVEMRRHHQTNDDSDYKKIQQSKRASQAMVQNNPDIADLSDVNRPTKVAERFSELYDNEWTEAFEALCRIKNGKLTEPKIIEILLEIVEEAYTFCLEEANSQIQNMEQAMFDILKGKERVASKQPAAHGRDLLVQYRKGIAGEALEYLQTKFRDKLNVICKARLQTPPPDGKPTVKYAQKAVELSWWMCVQDPPVHMCMKTSDINPSMYRAYTKSGSEPDFFVWPALKLHKDGGVLLKGVVQFK